MLPRFQSGFFVKAKKREKQWQEKKKEEKQYHAMLRQGREGRRQAALMTHISLFPVTFSYRWRYTYSNFLPSTTYYSVVCHSKKQLLHLLFIEKQAWREHLSPHCMAQRKAVMKICSERKLPVSSLLYSKHENGIWGGWRKHGRLPVL